MSIHIAICAVSLRHVANYISGSRTGWGGWRTSAVDIVLVTRDTEHVPPMLDVFW